MSLLSQPEIVSGTSDSPPSLVRVCAQLLSYVFHPLFIPLYVTYFVLYVHPLLFAGYDASMKVRLIATIFVNLTFLPAVTVFLCWRLRFISSLHMETQKERIIPLAAAMIFYFWCWFVLKNFSEIPGLYRQFLLGSFISIIGAWLANIWFKVSLHALSMGGTLCFMFLTLFSFAGGSAWYIAVATFVAGAVCSSRLLVSSHRPFEIYGGFMIGLLSQLIALIVSS